MKRPDFDSFRTVFLECLEQSTNLEPSSSAQTRWAELGNLEVRRQILESVNAKLLASCGLSFEVNHRLLKVEGSVESAIIQAYHELNTIYLVEKINNKIRGRLS
ncbi:MAG: hypothetical protein PHT62_02715 [Desulfotomaculaceae bacterium]|nr:hypothetical protein [Desulfotomaculaceae bacterium]